MDSRLKIPENLTKKVSFKAKNMKSNVELAYITSCNPSVHDISKSFNHENK